jgi:hypothetical protein
MMSVPAVKLDGSHNESLFFVSNPQRITGSISAKPHPDEAYNPHHKDCCCAFTYCAFFGSPLMSSRGTVCSLTTTDVPNDKCKSAAFPGRRHEVLQSGEPFTGSPMQSVAFGTAATRVVPVSGAMRFVFSKTNSFHFRKRHPGREAGPQSHGSLEIARLPKKLHRRMSRTVLPKDGGAACDGF